MGVASSPVGSIVSPPAPELDFVRIGNGQKRGRGTLDSFYAKVVVSLTQADAAEASYVRILRASNGVLSSAPSPGFSAMIDAMPATVSRKNTDCVAQTAFRAAAVGVGNRLTTAVHDDVFTGTRVVVASASLRPLPTPVNTNRTTSSPAGLVTLANADRSVLENVTFYVNQRSSTIPGQLQLPLQVVSKQGMNVLQGSGVSSASPIVQASNAAGFAEVARLTVANRPTVGGYVELEWTDGAVTYGSSYSYYAVVGNSLGLEGPRSRIIKADVIRVVPPKAPVTLFSVISDEPRFSLVCSGSFLDHIEVFRRGGKPPQTVPLLNTAQAAFDEGPPVTTDSGYYHIGDVGLGIDRSAVYVDTDVLAGQAYDYRIFTVDSFGFKSSTPFSCSITLPDYGSRAPLALPAITAEQSQGGEAVTVTLAADDDRVTSFIVSRIECKTHEEAFRSPTTPSYFTLGTPRSAKRFRSRSGPSLDRNSSKAWTGVLTAVSGAAQFVDQAVTFDRVYQYAVKSVDVRGNTTTSVLSAPVMVAVKPVSDSPVAVTAAVVLEPTTGAPTAVTVAWGAGTNDFSPNDLIGDQDVLASTAQRSVYQVERRAIGASKWEVMPATTDLSFSDPVSTAPAPKFRPPYAAVNLEYDYRVIAMQSGAYLSTYTDPVRIVVAPGITAPPILYVRSTPSSVRPVVLAVSWRYDGQFVDQWEIQRAVTNKIYGSKIFSMASADAQSLDYQWFATVPREASQGVGVSAEAVPLPTTVVPGNRFVLDPWVSLANSYFYRVRALDANGNPSAWTYGGIQLTDSPFDRKFMSSLTAAQKSSMATDPRPVSDWKEA
jgi:hypothetical protein